MEGTIARVVNGPDVETDRFITRKEDNELASSAVLPCRSNANIVALENAP